MCYSFDVSLCLFLELPDLVPLVFKELLILDELDHQPRVLLEMLVLLHLALLDLKLGLVLPVVCARHLAVDGVGQVVSNPSQIVRAIIAVV